MVLKVGIRKQVDIEHDVQYNVGKFLVMYFDSRNANLAREMTLGGKTSPSRINILDMSFVTTYQMRLTFKPK